MLAELEADDIPPTVTVKVNNGVKRGQLEGGPAVLNSRMVRMIELMIEGVEDDPSHTPLDVYAAAAAVGYRRRAARRLSVSPVFVAAYQAARAGQSIAHCTPTFDEVRREAEHRQRDRAARAKATGYVIRMPPRSAEPGA